MSVPPTLGTSISPRCRKVWRDATADHGEREYAAATGNDYPAHEQTYRSIVTLVKVGIGVVAIIVILMAYFLT